MSTLPGLPMFGHGQIEGFNERYGMEYRRAYHDEKPDHWLVARHERASLSAAASSRAVRRSAELPALRFLHRFGHVDENVFAYSNRLGDQRALVIFNNKFAVIDGWIRTSTCVSRRRPGGGRTLRQRTLSDGFGLNG